MIDQFAQPEGNSGRSVAAWLESRCRRDAVIYRGFSIVLWVVAIILLFGTLMIFDVIWYSVGLMFCGISRTFAFVLALATVVFLFWIHRWMTRERRSKYRFELSDGSTAKISLPSLSGPSWLLGFTTGFDEQPIIRWTVTILFLAPYTAMLARRAWGMARRLRSLPFDQLGAAVNLLIMAGGKTPFVAVAEQFPDRTPQGLFEDLACLDGVVFLPQEPAGVTVVPSLADEFEAWRKTRRSSAK